MNVANVKENKELTTCEKFDSSSIQTTTKVPNSYDQNPKSRNLITLELKMA